MRKGQFRFCANYVTIRFGKTYEPTKGMFNMNKITIIGTGSVGATIAYTLNTMGIASEIVLIDINTEKALGEALDIRQGNSFFGGNCSIYAGDYCDAAGSNIVILTSGIARKPEPSGSGADQRQHHKIHSAADNKICAECDLYHRQQSC